MKTTFFASGATALALLFCVSSPAQDLDSGDTPVEEPSVEVDVFRADDAETEDPVEELVLEVDADRVPDEVSDSIVADGGIGSDGTDEPAPAVAETVVVEVPEGEPAEPGEDGVIEVSEGEPSEDGAEPEEAGAALDGAEPLSAPMFDENGEARVSMAFEQSTLEDVVAAFRTQTGANIVNGWTNHFTQLVSVRLDDVPWRQGLASILVPFNLQLREEPRGSRIYIVAEPRHTAPPRFTEALELKHLEAPEVAKLFAGILPKDCLVYAEPSANVVIIKATDEQINECKAVLAKIDKPSPQVYIEARFVRLSAGASKKLGLKWDSLENFGVSLSHLTGGFEFTDARIANFRVKQGYRDGSETLVLNEGLTGDRDKSTIFSHLPPFGNVKNPDYTDNESWAVDHEALSGRGAQRWRGASSIVNYDTLTVTPSDAPLANITKDDLNYRHAMGFGGQLSVSDFGLVMSAFEQLDGAQVFSNPKIIVRNGKKAVVDMTTKYPNIKIDYQQSTESGQRDSISSSLATIPGKTIPWVGEAFFSYGITLEVTPTVSPNGLITVEIVPTISERAGTKTVYVTSDSSIGNDYPIIALRRLDTKFTMEDGKTAVIGGLTETSEKTVDSGIPLLRHIPWIGPRLFGWKSREKSQDEILVFVTVRIADPATQAVDGLPKNAILGQMMMEGRIKEPGDRTEKEMWDLESKPIGYSVP
jgi:Flp pilus assembly secretin CpaC